jgi:aryl-alcohol dehydrogenase-like predicted oxidoreductase
MSDFLLTPLGKLGTPVFRLGFSATYRPGKNAFHAAIDAGVNFFFYFGFDSQMTAPLREAIRGRREKFVLATGGYNWILWQSNLRKTLEQRLRQLRAGYIDVFLYLGALKGHHWTPRIAEDLQAVKESGLVRAVGLSTHHLPLAAQLAASGAVDLLMIRYNAAHRFAETQLFPHLNEHGPPVIAFTATCWARMTRRPHGYPPSAPVPSAGMCYRYALSNPRVAVCLSAPSNQQQLEENLAEIRKGPLDRGEMKFMQHFGDIVAARHRFFL